LIHGSNHQKVVLDNEQCTIPEQPFTDLAHAIRFLVDVFMALRDTHPRNKAEIQCT
jgi:uncharacterized heparinase superfamily protein